MKAQTSIIFTLIITIIILTTLTVLTTKKDDSVVKTYFKHYADKTLTNLLKYVKNNYTLMDYLVLESCGYETNYSQIVQEFINNSLKFKYYVEINKTVFTNIENEIIVENAYFSDYTIQGCENTTVKVAIV